MHVCQHIFSAKERIEQTLPVITLHQRLIFFFSGNGKKLHPDFQHAAGLKIQDIIHFFPAETAGPVVKPVRKIFSNFQRSFISRVFIHVQQAHKYLVDCIMGRPYLLPLGDPVQVFFRNRSGPLSAVCLLAFRQLVHNRIGFGLDFLVPHSMISHGGSGQPVPQKVSPQLTGGKFPAAVHSFYDVVGSISSSLQIEIKQKKAVFQMHHIASVFFFTALQLRII